MKIETSKLTGAALDWAVAKCEGELDKCDFYMHERGKCFMLEMGEASAKYSPSTQWIKGGPIMDEAEIDTYLMERGSLTGWLAEITGTKFKGRGATRLSAAMRCYVASKLGDEVEAPDELA